MERTFRYLSEFTVGEKFTTLSQTVTETDVVRIISAQIHAASDRLAERRAQRDALLQQGRQDELEPCFAAVPAEWHSYDIPEKKAVARAAIERVWVDDDAVEVVFRAAPPA